MITDENKKLATLAIVLVWQRAVLHPSHFIAAGWLQRIPSDARMMRTHGRI